MSGMNEPSYDPNLWFTMGSHCEGKHYLLWNPHTFHGRIAAWCPTKKVRFNISLSDIESSSLEAQYWVKGFLAGNEPEPPRDDVGDYLPDDHPKMIKWRAAIQQFPQTGIWVAMDRNCEKCEGELLPTQPGLLCPNCASEI